MSYLTPQNISAAIGLAYTVTSFLALIAPKGSRWGQIAAKFSADLKGHMTPAGKP